MILIKSNMIKSILSVTILALIAKLIGFSRSMILAYYFGTSVIADAYSLSIAVLTFAEVAFNAIAISYIPIYYGIREQKNKKLFLTKVNVYAFTLGAMVAIVIYFNLETVTALFLGASNKELFEIVNEILGMLIFVVPLYAIVAISAEHLKAEKKYNASVVNGIIFNVALVMILILSLSVLGVYSVNAIILSYLGAFFLQLVYLYYRRYKIGAGIKLSKIVWDKNLKKLCLIALPIFISTSADNINNLINKIIASSFAVGSISGLDYSFQIIMMITSIITVGITSVGYNSMVKLAEQNAYTELNKLYKNILIGTSFIVIPMAIGIIVLRKEIITLLFGRGEFTTAAIEETSFFLIFYTVGLSFYILKPITYRIFYALNHAKYAMYNGLVCIAVNIILSFILSKVLGVYGVALASSFAAMLVTITLLYKLNRITGFNLKKGDILCLGKIIISSAVMGIVLNYIRGWFVDSNLLNILLCVCVGIFIFLITSIILKNEIFNNMIKLIGKRNKEKD